MIPFAQRHAVSQKERYCSLHWTNEAGSLRHINVLNQGTIPTTAHLKWYP